MKKLLLAAAITVLAQQATAQAGNKVHLVCTGWAPVYPAFDAWPLNPSTDNNKDSFSIVVDKAQGAIRYNTQVGPSVAKLKETEEYYYGEAAVARVVLGKVVKLTNVSINRMTGESSVSYQFEGEKNGKVAFSGTCVPGKAMF